MKPSKSRPFSTEEINAFVCRWGGSAGGETSNFHSFAGELCDLLGVQGPDPSVQDDEFNTYVFEKSVRIDNGDGTRSTLSADLYKARCFVCEAKQGSDEEQQTELFATPGNKKTGFAKRGTHAWDKAMIKARQQADRYARHLGWPPFLIVVDVGHVIELYADFSGTGQNGYVAFPDPASHRIALDDLHFEEVRQRLAKVWVDPESLDSSKYAARVTREVADKLATLAKSLEASGRAPGPVSEFLMRCLFTMFAEDVDLLPRDSYKNLLQSVRNKPHGFGPTVESLWRDMDKGADFSVVLQGKIRPFNGALFLNAKAIPLNTTQIDLLIEASRADWSHVEPAIFGTLLERALDPRERHKLGAHYTPRAYVERLVMPTVIEPLRDEWAGVQATSMKLEGEGHHKEALDELRAFHRHLCAVKVLDPACGSGNFLYVTLEHMKRLEGEVIDVLAELDDEAAKLELQGYTVTPEQFLGIEFNERAAVIAEMVLWIGFLQWHFRTSGKARVPVPVLRNYGNIECRDAVLAWDEIRVKRDEAGKLVTHWDGRTTKPHAVTGNEVPDESAQIEDYEYISPRLAEWPEADYVVGNPPFIGNKRMRKWLGDGYTDAIRSVHPHVPETADYVMYWWDKAAHLVGESKLLRFGLISTNSIHQPFNRRIIFGHLTSKRPVSLALAIPDHPWVDASDGAAVRIAMTIGQSGKSVGELRTVTHEFDSGSDYVGTQLSWSIGPINSNLTIGVDVSTVARLRANERLARQGLIPLGSGFRLAPSDLPDFGLISSNLPSVVRRYRIGADLVQRQEEKYVIDFFGLSEREARKSYPALYQHLLTTVKPGRDQNKRKVRRENWWLFGENAGTLRPALDSISRYIATCRTAKHRIFSFLDSDILPDAKIIAIGLDDAYYLGILSSRVHVHWAMETGGWLGIGNDSNYNHADCFAKFPFPNPSEALHVSIRALGEELDQHRKTRQQAHPDLTATQMYNVMEALREDLDLTDREKSIHERGLVSVVKGVHDRLDASVIEAYGWPPDISNDEILERLVALNKERASEESRGIIHWLRPEYQNPAGAAPKVQEKLVLDMDEAPIVAKAKWPKTLPEQMRLLRGRLDGVGKPLTTEQVAATFKGARRKRVAELLDTLVSIGQARITDEGKYTVQ